MNLNMFLFRSKNFDPDQFEIELKKVSNKLASNEKKLRKLKSQKQYYQKIIPLYLSAGYVIYFSYSYQKENLKQFKTAILLFTIPLIIGLIYYTILIFFDYLINNRESYSETLKDKHNKQLDILKEKTNFDKTKDLLVRFSNGQDIKEMEKEASEIQKKREEYIKMIQDGEKGKVLEDLQKNQGNGLYDHFLNALLGENELGPERRYALICTKCLIHNGLAPPGKLPNEVRYQCPNCGTLNGDIQVDNKIVKEKNEETIINEDI
jgi:hypothetical protein